MGVEPICKVLPIAPSTYHDYVAKRCDPSRLSARANRDEALKAEVQRVSEENFRVYGVRRCGGNDDPGTGGLRAVKSFRLAVDDLSVFLDDDLGGEGLGAVFASPFNYRTIVVPIFACVVPVVPVSVGEASPFHHQRGTTLTNEVRRRRTTDANNGSKWAGNGTK